MNAAPYTHLLWKEYRAIRGFWIALIALAIFMELLVLAFAQDRGWATEFIYNIALATPVFFAIGCIGTAYAIEKEDGTFEWLRSSPASDAQLFVSKVGLCFVATCAMFGILWFLTQTVFVAPPDKSEVVSGLLGLWPLAGAEALAWGLLFSLLSARPLMAIVLALFATSTSVHVLSWIAVPQHPDEFQYTRYVAAIPMRLAVLALVTAADVYLGLRWLGSEERTSLLAPREADDATTRRPATKADITALLRHRDRAAILGRLTWQTLRQSGRTMFTLAALQVLLCLVTSNYGLDRNQQSLLPIAPLLAFTALMGASVFQADQQRGHFRFFVEHNVPPRYVWLTRLLPWIAVATLSTFLSVCAWIGFSAVLQMLLTLTFFASSIPYPQILESWWGHGERRLLETFAMPVIVSPLTIFAFAAGQWVSMTVRSGLLSGFFSLLLTAGLMAWLDAVYFMQLSWLAYLAPIPLLLFFATWLRAPDWILENTTWTARVKSAGVVLAPAVLLLAAAPFSRIAQVPDVTPGFDPAAYVAEITPAALETGEIYRRANELYNRVTPERERSRNFMPISDWAADRVSGNAETLDLILKASERTSCALANPATLTNWPVITPGRLTSLLGASAYVLEGEHKLDEALDRYATSFVVEQQLSSFAPRLGQTSESYLPLETMERLTQWAARPDQTEAQVREAIARLEQIDASVLNWDDALKSNYILCQRMLDGDENVGATLFPGKNSSKELARILFNLRLFPWEGARERRLLKVQTQAALQELALVRRGMEAGENVDQFVSLQRNYTQTFGGLLSGTISSILWSTGRDAINSEVKFETQRRVTLIILACQAFRLKHGELPIALEQLREEAFLDKLPNDPLSGRPFVYFSRGIPEPRTEEEKRVLKRSGRSLLPDAPLLWSPGMHLSTRVVTPNSEQPEIVEVYYRHRPHYYDRYGDYRDLPDYNAWLAGDWYPIPAKK
jgi:hypothetical protein